MKTMKILFAAVVFCGLLWHSCQKDEIQQVKPVETDDLLLKSGHEEPKMVPFKGSGTWQYAAPPEIVEEGEVLEVIVALQGNITRLGRFQGIETYLFKFEYLLDEDGEIIIDPDTGYPVIIPNEYLSHTSTYTAANGDELHNEGSDLLGSVHEFHDPLGTGFSLTGVQIVSGTGRFENAAGWYDFWVNKDCPGDPGGTWEFEGEISTVGSTPRGR